MQLRLASKFLGFTAVLAVASSCFGQVDQANEKVLQAATQVGSLFQLADNLVAVGSDQVVDVKPVSGFYTSTQDVVIGGDDAAPQEDAAPPEVDDTEGTLVPVPSEDTAIEDQPSSDAPAYVAPAGDMGMSLQSGYTPIYSNGVMIGACPPGYTCTPGGGMTPSAPMSMPMDMGYMPSAPMNMPSMPMDMGTPSMPMDMGTPSMPMDMGFQPQPMQPINFGPAPSDTMPISPGVPSSGLSGLIDLSAGPQGQERAGGPVMVTRSMQVVSAAPIAPSVSMGGFSGGAVGGSASYSVSAGCGAPACQPQRRRQGGCFQRVLNNIRSNGCNNGCRPNLLPQLGRGCR